MSQYDTLLVNQYGLVDLEAKYCDDFPFPGSGTDLQEEIERIQQLLIKASPPTAPLLGLKEKGASAVQEKQQAGKLTESSRGKQSKVMSYGHSVQQVREIEEGNARLVQRLHAVAQSPVKIEKNAKEHDRHMANATRSALLKRQKDEETVDEANMLLYRKLQEVKPSKVVDRRVLRAQFKANRKLLCKLTPRREGPQSAPPGMQELKVWNDRWQIGV